MKSFQCTWIYLVLSSIIEKQKNKTIFPSCFYLRPVQYYCIWASGA